MNREQLDPIPQVSTTPNAPTTLEVGQVRTLADDLLHALAPHVGDPEAVATVLTQWLDTLDVHLTALVCMAAVRRTFADCLHTTPLDQVPAGATTYTDPEENTP